MTAFDARSYWDTRLRKNWSLHGVGIKNLSHNYNRWLYRVRRAVFRRTVRRHRLTAEQPRVLDIGSGTGFYIHLWQRAGAGQITGMDIADSAVERLRDRYPQHTFTRADISTARPYEPETFDVISAFDMLFHIVDDDAYRQAFTHMHDMLRPGGALVFTENFLRASKRGHARHFVSRSLASIETVLRQTGFSIRSRDPAFVLMNVPVDASRQWRSNLWRKRIRPLIRNERRGNIVGAALYPLELLLTRLLSESDTTEIMVVRKAAD